MHCLVVEEGVYSVADHGVKMEAVKYVSTVTDNKSSWVGEGRSYANSYADPVVLGQVMSYNDPAFSVFWARGETPLSPPSGSVLFTRKHVGKDPSTSRAAETVGYIVIESGAGTIGSVDYVAGLGADTVTDSASTYALSGLASVSAAVVSQAAMDGVDGSWAVLHGPNPVTPDTLTLSADEDKIADNEQGHTSEQVSYIIFQ